MKRLFHFLCLVLTIAGRAQDTARMEELVRAHAAGDRFMGSVLVAKDGAIVFERSTGWANLEWKIPHGPATKFRIGSVTKQFTAAAILLLAERGRLQLEDPLSKFVPSAPENWKEATLRAQVFKPLGMNDSGHDSNTAVIPQRASGYLPGANGLINAPYIDMHVPHGAGALYSTTADLLRWTQGLFGGKLLSADSLETMTTPTTSPSHSKAASKPVPDGLRPVTPYLVCAGASAAIAFFQKAFDATELMRLPEAAAMSQRPIFSPSLR